MIRPRATQKIHGILMPIEPVTSTPADASAFITTTW